MSGYSYILLGMEVTPKQKALLEAINESVSKTGTAPTLKELRDALGVSSDQSIVQFLDRLEEGGFITRVGQRRSRKIFLTEKAYSLLGIVPPQKSQAIVSMLPPSRSSYQEKIYQLLIDISGELGRIYSGGLMALGTENNPEVLVQSAQSMRELIVALAKSSKFKFPKSLSEEIAEACSQIGEDADKESLKKILEEVVKISKGREPWIKEALVSQSDPIASNRRSGVVRDGIHQRMNEMYHRFSAISHHDPITQRKYSKLLSEFESLLLVVLLPQRDIHTNIDKILSAGPSKILPEKLKLLLSRNTDAFAYFYDNAGSEWISYLMSNDLLPFEWEVGRYLIRMTDSAPEKVLEFIEKNQSEEGIHKLLDSLMKAVESMPPEIAEKAIPIIKQRKWLQSEYRSLGVHYIEDLFKKLVATKNLKPALSLFEELSNVRETDGSFRKKARTTSEDYGLSEVLKELKKLEPSELPPFIDVLKKRLEKMIRIESGKDYDDHSTISRPSIGSSDHNWHHEGLDDLLIDSLRDSLIRYAEYLNEPSAVTDYLEEVFGESPKFATLARIKLHVYRQIKSPLPEAVKSALKKYIYDRGVWHEYALLLQAVYPQLSPTEKKKIIGLVEHGPTDENDAKFAHRWRVRFYATISSHLPKAIQKKYQKELDLYAGKDPTFTSGKMETWVGPESPVKEEDLAKKPLAEIISENFINWHPKEDFHFGPSRSGLGQIFKNIASSRAEEFSAQAMLMADIRIRPVYIHNFLSAVLEVGKNGKIIDWTETLKLIQWIIGLAKDNKLPVFEDGPGVDRYEIDWQEVLRQIARTIRDFLADNNTPFNESERSICFETIAYLAEHSDPTIEHEEKYGGKNGDPFTMSINTVRGEAYHALFGYIFRVSRSDGKNHIPPEAVPLLERGIDLSLEHSLAVRSVYGRYLPWLIGYGEEWANTLLPKLLPINNPAQRYAVWETYLSNQVFEDVFKTFLPFYKKAVDELGKVNLEREFWADPFERLAQHIIIGYVNEVGIEAQTLAEYFFEKAPQEHKAIAISFAGRAFISRENFSPGEKIPKLTKLTKLWESRLKSKASTSELREFGWWVKKGAFKDKWMLEKLLETLELTQGGIEGDHVVLKTLNELAEAHPLLVVKCLNLIVRSTTNRDFTLQIYTPEIREALKKILTSKDSETIKLARKVVDHLLRLEFREYKNIEDLGDNS